MKLKFGTLVRKFTWLDWLLLILVVGFLGYLSISGFSKIFQKQTPVEFVASNDETVLSKDLVVDVSGAVVAAGVYKLPAGSRIKDAIVAAGGLASDADRDYLSMELNQAAIITDGMKIFVPSIKRQVVGGSGERVLGVSTAKVNINTASISQLDELYGVGESRAQQIIDGRPYAKVDELVSKKILSKSVVDKIRDKISVY